MSGTELVPGKLKREAGVHKETSIIHLVTFAFLVLTIIKVINHEMWGDETEPWLIARDSNSISELLFNKRFESHPNLWYFLLYGVTRFSHNVHLMQALHVVIATGAAFIFLRYASFPLLTRVLFCFGYFMFYEFSVLSRIYALGLLFIFGACALYPYRYKYWLLFCVLLSLAAQANLFSGMIAGGIVLVAFYEYFFVKALVPETFLKQKFWFGAAILLFAFLYAMLSMMKHPDHTVTFNPIFHIYYINQKLSFFFNAFFPLAPFEVSFWDKNIFPSSYKFKILTALPVLGFICVCLWPKKHIIYAYGFVLLAMLSFFFFLYNTTAIRHYGHMFILFIVMAWIKKQEESDHKTVIQKMTFYAKSEEWGVNFILFIHVVAGLQASIYDLAYRFSAYKDVAAFLDSHVDASSFIVGTNEVRTSAVTAYSKKFKKIYFYNTRRTGSYFIPDASPEKELYSKDSLTQVMAYCRDLSFKQKKDLIVISVNRELATQDQSEIKEQGGEILFTSNTNLIFNYPLTVYKLTYSTQLKMMDEVEGF